MRGKFMEQMSQKIEIDIGRDFSPFPGGRVKTDGPYSGENFRERFVLPKLREGKTVVINIDSAEGFGSSFLEECFGGLVRAGLSYQFLKDHLQVVYSKQAYSFYADEIWKYIEDASK